MKNLTIITGKVFSKEFYRLNVALHFLIIAVAGGVMSGIEHKALALFFISSPITLLIPFLVWLLYTMKVMVFNHKALHQPQNEFIYLLMLLKYTQQFFIIVLVAISQLMLPIIYGIFLIVMANQNNFSFSIFLIITFLVICVLTGAAIFIYDLRKPNPENKIGFIRQFIDLRFNRPYIQFFIEWLARKHLTTLVSTKVFSCVLIFGVCKLYTTDIYDWRLLAIVLTIAFGGNLMLLYNFQQFEERHFSMIRSLPISLIKRLLNFFIIFFILCVPEIGILSKNFPEQLSIGAFATNIIYSANILLTIYASLYISDIPLERIIQSVFVFLMLLIVAILFSIPLLLISSLLLIFGIILFKKYYYSFEFEVIPPR